MKGGLTHLSGVRGRRGREGTRPTGKVEPDTKTLQSAPRRPRPLPRPLSCMGSVSKVFLLKVNKSCSHLRSPDLSRVKDDDVSLLPEHEGHVLTSPVREKSLLLFYQRGKTRQEGSLGRMTRFLISSFNRDSFK